MATIVIQETGCRDCNLCIDTCPTKVLDHDDARGMARVVRADDCIGCTSCQFICPSRCIIVSDIAIQRPFFRIEENKGIVRRMLQRAPAMSALTEKDVSDALTDVCFRVNALADSITETMGRGQRAVGRKAGALAASHLPEMYEGSNIEEVLAGMQRRFRGGFDFEPKVGAGGTEITMQFAHCGMHRPVEQAGGKVGDHVLCQLFHEYWAGLVSTFLGKSFAIEMLEVGARCTMKLSVRN